MAAPPGPGEVPGTGSPSRRSRRPAARADGPGPRLRPPAKSGGLRARLRLAAPEVLPRGTAETAEAAPSRPAVPQGAPPPGLTAVRRRKAGPAPGARPAKTSARRQAVHRFQMLAIVLLASTVVAPLVATWSPGHAFVIASDSMGRTIPKGSFVLATGTDAAALEVGDIIVYDAVTGVREVHRIDALVERPDGATAYRTKGDANEAADSYVVEPADVVGEVRGHAPYLGYLWLVPTLWQVLLFAGLVLAYVAITLWDARKSLRRLHGASLVMGILLVLVLPGFDAAVLGLPPSSAHTAAVATPPLPFSSGAWGTTTTANGGNTASTSLTTPKLWKETQLWGCSPGTTMPPTCTFTPLATSYGTGSTSTSPNLALADTGALDGTVQYHLEATLTAQSGRTVSVQLYDVTAGSAVSGSEVSTTSTTATTVRSSGFSLSGANEVQWQAKVSGGTSSTVSSVKLLSSQQFPTKTQTSVPVSGAGQTAALSTSFSVPVGATKWVYETDSLDGTVTVHVEAVVDAPLNILSATTTSVRLVDLTSASTVTTLTTTSASPVRLRSAPLSLVDGHEYEVELATSSIAVSARLYMARVLLTQTSFTETLRYEDLTTSHTTTSSSYTTVGAGGRHNAATEWGSLSATFEATLRNSGAGTTSLQLYDTTGSAAIAGSTLTLASSTASRQRASVTLAYGDPGTYVAQLKASANTAEVRTAWIILAQANGKTYDTALQASNDVAGSCTWSFAAALTGSTGLSKLTAAKVQLRGDGGTQDQVVVSGGSATQTVGTAVSTAFGNDVAVVAQSRPNAAGAIQLDLDLQGTCGGIHTLQPFSLVLQ